MCGRALMKRFAIVPESILYMTLKSEIGLQLLIIDLQVQYKKRRPSQISNIDIDSNNLQFPDENSLRNSQIFPKTWMIFY